MGGCSLKSSCLGPLSDQGGAYFFKLINKLLSILNFCNVCVVIAYNKSYSWHFLATYYVPGSFLFQGKNKCYLQGIYDLSLIDLRDLKPLLCRRPKSWNTSSACVHRSPCWKWGTVSPAPATATMAYTSFFGAPPACPLSVSYPDLRTLQDSSGCHWK